jgi:hypothetical protein
VKPIIFFLSRLTGIHQLKQHLDMKLSQIKTELAAVAADNREAFTEISAKITDMQTKIDDLIAGNSDPEVTDADFLATLESLKADAQALADVVPNPAEPDPETPADVNNGGEAPLTR